MNSPGLWIPFRSELITTSTRKEFTCLIHTSSHKRNVCASRYFLELENFSTIKSLDFFSCELVLPLPCNHSPQLLPWLWRDFSTLKVCTCILASYLIKFSCSRWGSCLTCYGFKRQGTLTSPSQTSQK
jgi:hypothetical protein